MILIVAAKKYPSVLAIRTARATIRTVDLMRSWESSRH
jgi:hypothetical protein